MKERKWGISSKIRLKMMRLKFRVETANGKLPEKLVYFIMGIFRNQLFIQKYG